MEPSSDYRINLSHDDPTLPCIRRRLTLVESLGPVLDLFSSYHQPLSYPRDVVLLDSGLSSFLKDGHLSSSLRDWEKDP